MSDFDDIDTGVPALPAESSPHLSALISLDGVVSTMPLPHSDYVTIGRDPSCDLIIQHGSISRKHARLRVSPLEITDLGSRNGTRVRGVLLAPGTPVPVTFADGIQIGHAVVLLHSTPPLEGESEGSSALESNARRLEMECTRSARSGSPFAFVRVEVRDGAAGDIGDLLRRTVRTSDVVGSESETTFWALLVDTTAEQARLAVSRMTQLFERYRISATMGIARYPCDGVTAEQLSAHAWEQLSRSPADPPTEMDNVRELITQIAPSEVSVLITGETGVGKELCAEMIHRLSARATKPFVKLNCAAVVESLIESEVFGHERGAFTGATSSRAGLLEAGNGGTVFLDEIGELPLAVQSKLLRVLEERVVRRVGAASGKTLDVRFVCASNRILADEVEAGRFRRDLYYRINGVTLAIPPLRERRSEIEGLARTFAARSRSIGSALVVSPDVLARLEAHAWPGNIRELRNTIERAVLVSSGGVLRPSHLALETTSDIATRPVTRVTLTDLQPIDASSDLATAVADLERQRILHALEQCDGNQSQAARMLGISRNTLRSRLEAFGLSRSRKA